MKDKEFTSYLEGKNLAKSTQSAYLGNVQLFLAWYRGEAMSCTKRDVLKYLEYLKTERKQENITRNNHLIALNHYFTFLVQIGEAEQNPTALLKIRGTQKKKLYRTYTAEELQTLYDNYYHVFIRTFDDSHIPKNQRQQSFLSRQRNHAMLGMLIYQGLHTNELQRIGLEDVDPSRATVRIGGGRKSSDRKIPLNASQIGSLITYINTVRPQFFTYCAETEQLFFALPESGKLRTSTQNLMHTFKPITAQVKSIDKSFTSFKQIRASVITSWIKNHGLRKAQYLAGHKYIHTTETYLTNDLESLTEDITKFNPF